MHEMKIQNEEDKIVEGEKMELIRNGSQLEKMEHGKKTKKKLRHLKENAKKKLRNLEEKTKKRLLRIQVKREKKKKQFRNEDRKDYSEDGQK